MKGQPSSSRFARLAVLTAVLSAGVLWHGCSSETLDSPAAPEPMGSLALSGRPPDLARAIAAQERHTPRLMAIPGVVGTAVGLDLAGKPIVKVFTTRAGIAGIPGRVEEVEVGVEVTGLFVAGSNPTTKQRPAPLGFSVGHPDITAGTIGARVKDASGALYILSNNHVLANSNDASIGDPELQPGTFDGGTAADQVGTLSDFQPINFSGGNNTIDAAIAATTAANVGFATPTDDGYGAPSAMVFGGGLLGLNVKKYGRTTELTQGQITEVNVTVSVCYEVVFIFCTKSATFVNQLGIGSGSFSAGGDSGSLIVSQSGNNPVGLLFAGSSTRTLANPIGPVLDRFAVTIDDGSGGGGNVPPTASFTFNCSGLSCSFDASGASDPDGVIQSYAWTFGDGATGTGVATNHTFAANGTYTITLTVTDDDDATDSDQHIVTVSDGSDTTMHVGDLDGSSTSQGNRWTANVTIRVHDNGHAAVTNATVTGAFSNGTNGSRSCTTNSAGACSVSRNRIQNRRSSVRFTVTGVTHATRTYASGANHDPDGDSNGTSITIPKP